MPGPHQAAQKSTRMAWFDLRTSLSKFISSALMAGVIFYRCWLVESCTGKKLLLFPATAQGFDKLHGGDEPLTGQLCIGALGGKCIPVRVHDFDITDDAGTITIRGK